jgi:hypothetical protein
MFGMASSWAAIWQMVRVAAAMPATSQSIDTPGWRGARSNNFASTIPSETQTHRPAQLHRPGS